MTTLNDELVKVIKTELMNRSSTGGIDQALQSLYSLLEEGMPKEKEITNGERNSEASNYIMPNDYYRRKGFNLCRTEMLQRLKEMLLKKEE